MQRTYAIIKRTGTMSPLDASKLGPGCTIPLSDTTVSVALDDLDLAGGVNALETFVSTAEIVSTRKGKLIYVTEYMLEEHTPGESSHSLDLGFVPAKFFFLGQEIL